MKLLYIANARIPSEKAHPYQILKMCEAFAQSGAEVELVVPFRVQTPQMRWMRGVWTYYCGVVSLTSNLAFRPPKWREKHWEESCGLLSSNGSRLRG